MLLLKLHAMHALLLSPLLFSQLHPNTIFHSSPPVLLPVILLRSLKLANVATRLLLSFWPSVAGDTELDPLSFPASGLATPGRTKLWLALALGVGKALLLVVVLRLGLGDFKLRYPGIPDGGLIAALAELVCVFVTFAGQAMYLSLNLLISLSRFRHGEKCSPPSLLLHTRLNTLAFSASNLTNPGKLPADTNLGSAAGDNSGKPGADRT